MKNTVNLIGRIGKDVVIKEVKDNKTVTTFQLATEEIYKDGDEKKKITEWHQIELWDKTKLAEILASGMLVNIDGSLRTTTWPKKVGEESVTMARTSIRAERIIILSKKPEPEQELENAVE